MEFLGKIEGIDKPVLAGSTFTGNHRTYLGTCTACLQSRFLKKQAPAIPLLAVPCTPVPTAVISSLFLFAVTAAFVLPVGTNMLWNAPQVYLSNLSVSSTVIAFLLLTKISGTFSLKTSLLNCLFHSVSSVISRMFFNLNHAKKLYSRLYHGPPYFRQGSQMESPHPLSPFRRRLQ